MKSKASLFQTPDGQRHLFTFALVCVLFFILAVCSSLLDSMDKHFQDFLHLSKSQSAWVQFAHYLGYFLMALPAGWLTQKLGYKGGILVGLGITVLGCLWFIPATKIAMFWAFLLGVAIVAMGLTFLETVANPYATVLGPAESSATRINFAQSFNGLGWPLGPILGGMFFYATKEEGGAQAANETLWIPYAWIGGFVLLLFIAFIFIRFPDVQVKPLHTHSGASPLAGSSNRKLTYWLLLLNVVMISFALATTVIAFCSFFDLSDKMLRLIFAASAIIPIIYGSIKLWLQVKQIDPQSIYSYHHLWGATAAQFFYVAAQAGTFAFFMNYITEEIPSFPPSLQGSWIVGGATGTVLNPDGILKITEKGASILQAIAFGLFTIGGFTGSLVLKKFKSYRVLGLYALLCTILNLLIAIKLGWLSALALFLNFYFMALLYPTIFALGIFGLGDKTKIGASFIVMAIMGGAILPKAMGWLGDHYGMSIGFLMPAACFFAISFYGWFWPRLSGSR